MNTIQYTAPKPSTIEGWIDDEYFSMFSEQFAKAFSLQCHFAHFLPGMSLVGLRSWDEFIAVGDGNKVYAVPTVLLSVTYAQPFTMPDISRLEPDRRYTGRVKWYVKPLLFGGRADEPSNVTWISYEEHAELVAYWNAMLANLSHPKDGH